MEAVSFVEALAEAAPLHLNSFEDKIASKNRIVLRSPTLTGTIFHYVGELGVGLILPDNPGKLPQAASVALAKAVAEAEADGMFVKHPRVIYFRDSDVCHPARLKLAAGASCTFQVYIDERGVGACDVSCG